MTTRLFICIVLCRLLIFYHLERIRVISITAFLELN